MWTLIIIIVFVVVVDDDTDYWVYLSSDHLFQVYYKVRQVLLQSATAFFITKCDGLLLQSATAFLLQSATSVVTKCDRYYKVWQFYYKVQSATIITKCDSTARASIVLDIKWEQFVLQNCEKLQNYRLNRAKKNKFWPRSVWLKQQRLIVLIISDVMKKYI